MKGFGSTGRATAIAVMLLLPCTAIAQQPAALGTNGTPSNVRAAVAHKLALDLAKLQSEIVAAGRTSAMSTPLLEVTSRTAAVRAGAAKSAVEAFTAIRGENLRVLDRVGAFYAVCTPNAQGVCPADAKTGWIPAADVKPKLVAGYANNGALTPYSYGTAIASVPAESLSQGVYETITKYAMDFRDEYKNNPYVQVSGFTVDITFPPALELSFSFKQP